MQTSKLLVLTVLLTGCYDPNVPGMVVNGTLSSISSAQDLAREAAERRTQCEQGSPRDCVVLAAMHVDGRGVPRDRQVARQLFQPACQAGDLLGCAGLGGLLLDAGDLGQGIALVQRACQGGQPLGCSMLATAHLIGRGVSRDLHRARELYEQSCGQGCTLGCIHLGELYQTGLGVTEDQQRAAQLFAVACDAGSLEGCSRLAAALLVGRGVPRNPELGARVFDETCQAGYMPSCGALALLILDGSVVPRNPVRAAHLLDRGREGGHGGSCTTLGYLHYTGQGVTRDQPRAAALFNRACEGGDMDGCTALARRLDEGQGVRQDPARAATLLERACDGGEQGGCCELGLATIRGRGRPADSEQGRALLQQSCEQGFEPSCRTVEQVAGGSLEPRTLAGVAAHVTGPAPVRNGSRCTVEIQPAWSCSLNCRVAVACDGVVIYGAPGFGFNDCSLSEGAEVEAHDPNFTGDYGDPRLDLDTANGRVTVTDRQGTLTWSVMIRPPGRSDELPPQVAPEAPPRGSI